MTAFWFALSFMIADIASESNCVKEIKELTFCSPDTTCPTKIESDCVLRIITNSLQNATLSAPSLQIVALSSNLTLENCELRARNIEIVSPFGIALSGSVRIDAGACMMCNGNGTIDNTIDGGVIVLEAKQSLLIGQRASLSTNGRLHGKGGRVVLRAREVTVLGEVEVMGGELGGPKGSVLIDRTNESSSSALVVRTPATDKAVAVSAANGRKSTQVNKFTVSDLPPVPQHVFHRLCEGGTCAFPTMSTTAVIARIKKWGTKIVVSISDVEQSKLNFYFIDLEDLSTTWTPICSDCVWYPPTRRSAVMEFYKDVMIFGYGENGIYLNDVYMFNLTENKKWVPVCSDCEMIGGPRRGYDIGTAWWGSRLLLYGGTTTTYINTLTSLDASKLPTPVWKTILAQVPSHTQLARSLGVIGDTLYEFFGNQGAVNDPVNYVFSLNLTSDTKHMTILCDNDTGLNTCAGPDGAPESEGYAEGVVCLDNGLCTIGGMGGKAEVWQINVTDPKPTWQRVCAGQPNATCNGTDGSPPVAVMNGGTYNGGFLNLLVNPAYLSVWVLSPETHSCTFMGSDYNFTAVDMRGKLEFASSINCNYHDAPPVCNQQHVYFSDVSFCHKLTDFQPDSCNDTGYVRFWKEHATECNNSFTTLSETTIAANGLQFSYTNAFGDMFQVSVACDEAGQPGTIAIDGTNVDIRALPEQTSTRWKLIYRLHLKSKCACAGGCPARQSRCNGCQHGTCNEETGCVCYNSEDQGHWGGAKCNNCSEHYILDTGCKIMCSENDTCSGHGSCKNPTSSSQCHCHSRFSGKDCSKCKVIWHGSKCEDINYWFWGCMIASLVFIVGAVVLLCYVQSSIVKKRKKNEQDDSFGNTNLNRYGGVDDIERYETI